MIINAILFIVIAILGGLGSSWYMIEKGSRLTTMASGPWVTWVAAGRTDADPYTRAHFLRRGMLPVTSTLSQSYQATTDSDGQALYSACDYSIEGPEPTAAFWSLAVFDEKGSAIPNPADRYAFSSTTIMRPANGQLDVRIARNARPGNWLPTSGAGRLTVLLTLDEPPISDDHPLQLPLVRRVACR